MSKSDLTLYAFLAAGVLFSTVLGLVLFGYVGGLAGFFGFFILLSNSLKWPKRTRDDNAHNDRSN